MVDESRSGQVAGGWWLPLACYTALALLLVAPVLRAPFRLVIGHPDSDIWKHLWHHWLVRDGLAEGMIGCYRVPWLGAPDGVCLLDADLVNDLAVLPISALSIPLAVHLVLIGQLVAGAMAANLLARRVTGDRIAALVTGCAYTFSCYVLFHPIASGVHERLHLALPALGLLLALHVRDRGGSRSLALLGVVLAILALASPAYSLFLALGIALLAPLDLVLRAPPAEPTPRRVIAARWGAVAVVAMLAYGASAGLASRCVADEARGGTGVGGDPSSQSPWATPDDPLQQAGKMETLSLECFFSPTGLEACASRDVDFLFRFPYPGYVLLLLGAGGLVFGRRRRARAMAAVGFLLLLIALGPVIRGAEGEAAVWIAHPTAWLARVVPFAHRVHIWQAVFLAQLLLGIGAAELIAARVPPPRRLAAAAAASLLVVVEVVLVGHGSLPLPVTDTRIPDVYEELVGHDGEDRAPEQILLDLPPHAVDPRIGTGRYVWYQSRHQRAIPYAINPGGFEQSPLIHFVHDETAPADTAADHLALWESHGARYVVLHRRHASAAEARRVEELMDAVGGIPIYEDGEQALYELPGGAEGPGTEGQSPPSPGWGSPAGAGAGGSPAGTGPPGPGGAPPSGGGGPASSRDGSPSEGGGSGASTSIGGGEPEPGVASEG